MLKTLDARLRVLEHLTYVLECVSMDYMGEGKTELTQLIGCLQSDESYRVPNSCMMG